MGKAGAGGSRLGAGERIGNGRAPDSGPTLLATYRVQMHKEFTLEQARRIVPYLERLGVSHLYTSPILKARPGSTHGYDVADPTVVNPELGSDDERRALVAELHGRGMGLLLDIVPNHMGIGPSNPYWEDVLTHGRTSKYAAWFDIDWDVPTEEANERILLPVLGDRFDTVVSKGELTIVEQDGAWRLCYFDNTFPLDPATLEPVKAWVAAGKKLAEFSAGAEGAGRVRALVERQHYKPVLWKRAANEINYRRFFDINELAALHMEDEPVFEATHAAVLGWIRAGELDGLRIDHIDGLRAPLQYLKRLRARVGDRPIVVEKILSPGEHLRTEWPVQGTTGYEFLNDLEAVFIEPRGYEEIERGYRRIAGGTGAGRAFHEIAREAKVKILGESLAADVIRLGRLARAVFRHDRAMGEGKRSLANPIRELIASFPVYRTYVDERGVSREDREIVDRAAADARRFAREPALVDAIRRILLYEPLPDSRTAERKARLRFVTRFQQTSGPATAKGIEDTALYRFVPLASRNEVGGEPDRELAPSLETLHRANAERAGDWPYALLCTNTHDTKRSADVRARLDVLSEIPADWLRTVRRWRRANAGLRAPAGPREAPEARTEYLLYQTLVGVWPVAADDRGRAPDGESLASLRERVAQYMEKATREAKLYTSWTAPDEAYEKGVADFLAALLDPANRATARWREEMHAFVARIARPGLWTALSRIVLHLAAPGTPDLYQGDELWNFALVDPDNRRPVDYALRERMLAEVERAEGKERVLREMMARPEDGRIKLHVTRALLQARRRWPESFAAASYRPLAAEGARARHVVAFARGHGAHQVVAVAPRFILSLASGGGAPVGHESWGETRVAVTARGTSESRWRCAISGRIVEARHGKLELGSILDPLPVALLVSVASSKQGLRETGRPARRNARAR